MSLTRCVDCGDMYENTLYEGRCPHRMRHDPTPPAPAMPEVKGICASCGDPLDSGFLCSECTGDDDVSAELTTLRQRLAEAEADLKQMSQHADAWKEAFDREWNRAEKAEAEKSRLVSAMTAENLRVAADAARWEGAARVLAKEIKVHRWSVDPGHHEETDEAIRITDQHPTASALVRERGGGE